MNYYLLIHMLEHVAEVRDQVLLEQLDVGRTNVLADGVDEAHDGEHSIWLHLLQSLLDDSTDDLSMSNIFLGDISEGVNDNFVVKSELRQSVSVSVCHLARETHKIHFD